MAAQEVDALLYSLTGLGRRVFGAAACSLAVLEPDEEHLLFRAADGAGAEEVVGLRLPVSRGIAGWVVSSGQPIAVHDVRADPRFAVDVAESTGYVPQSILAAPMTASGEAIGVVEVLDRRPVDGRDDMELLTLFATQAALAVDLVDRTSAARPPGPEPAAVLAEAARLGADEQRVVAGLVTEFLAYLGRRGGPAGLV
jgi:GAF domain-containing protein